MAIKHLFTSAKADAGDATIVEPSDWNADHVLDDGTVTRAKLAADGKNWTDLGGTVLASPAVRTATITWLGSWAQLWFEFFIAAYSNTAIGRVIVGTSAGPSETATLMCTTLIEGVTLNTTAVSVPGWPTAVTVNNVERHGQMWITNQTAKVKRMNGVGQHAGTAPTVAPLTMQWAGMWNNTSALINSASLVVYDTLTATTVSARTFNAGTFLNVWGRNND